MRRILTVLTVAFLLLCLPVAAQGEETTHTHCICGGAAEGVGDHTQCQDVEFTPISEAFAAVGRSMSKADFGKLPDGYYYLDGDVVVTSHTAIGKIKMLLDENGKNIVDSKGNKLMDTEPEEVRHIVICLNGHSITATGKEVKPFGYLHMESSLTICDCSYNGETFAGSVTGCVRSYGSVIYTRSRSTLNIYGGNFYGQATVSGGTLAIACDDCGDLNGNGEYENNKDTLLSEPAMLNLYNGYIAGTAVTSEGGAIKLFHTAGMNMYGGTVVGGSAVKGGAISASVGTVNLYGGTVVGADTTSTDKVNADGTTTHIAATGGAVQVSSGGSCYITGAIVTGGTVDGAREIFQVINANGKLLATYTNAQKALTAVAGKTDRYLRLIADLETDITLPDGLHLDLAGHTLSGVKLAGDLYGMDSTTNEYDGTRAGKLIPVSGKPVAQHKTTEAMTGNVMRYLALQEDGGWSFHRFYMGITKLTLRPDDVGFGYKAYFAGSDTVKAALDTYGFRLWIEDGQSVVRTKPASMFNDGQEISLVLRNFLSSTVTDEENARRSELPVSANVYLQFKDGTLLETEAVTYEFRDMCQRIDGQYSKLSHGQKRRMEALTQKFSRTMKFWDISNTHHIKGTVWHNNGLNNTKFHEKLDKSNKLAGGTYYLTGDVDLAGKVVQIASGTSVTICLNGYDIISTARMFKVYGHLTICDCHAGEETEGNLISSLSGEKETYAPVLYAYAGGVVDLYGGNLKATGTGVTSAGVCALSHDNKDKTLPSAVMHMYGGTVSGGKSLSDSGLIALWNDASFYMYGGKLYGGTAVETGGAISASSGSVVELADGMITGSTASSGGAVYMEGGSLKISGCMVIENNTASVRGNNVYPSAAVELDLEALDEGSRVTMCIDGYRIIGQNPELAEYVICENPEQSVVSLYGRMTVADGSMKTLSNPAGFTVGFGEVCIDPDTLVGVPLSGYGTAKTRLTTEESIQGRKDYDKLYAQVLAVTDELGETVILITCDVIRPSGNFTPSVVNAIHAATNIPKENIFVNCSHSHSVPEINQTKNPLIIEYNADIPVWLAQATYDALMDRAPATMETGSFDVMTADGKRMNFMRHYKAVDDSGVLRYFGDHFSTAPGGKEVYNSTTQHIWEIDPTMYLVRFVRDGKDILMANWRVHPHMTGGADARKLSSDLIGTLRYYMKQKLSDTHFMYVQGAAGNANETSRLNEKRSSDYGTVNMNHGLNYVQYGQTLAGLIVDNLKCLKATPTGKIQVENYGYTAYYDLGDEAEYKAAMALKDEIDADASLDSISKKAAVAREHGYDSYYELGFIIKLYNYRKEEKTSVQLPLNAFSIGSELGFFTAPGEMWDTVSLAVEEGSSFATTICVGYSQEQHNYMIYYPESYLKTYFPAGTTLTNGSPYKSYESQNRRYQAPQTIEGMIDYWIRALNGLYANAAVEE